MKALKQLLFILLAFATLAFMPTDRHRGKIRFETQIRPFDVRNLTSVGYPDNMFVMTWKDSLKFGVLTKDMIPGLDTM